MALRKPLRTRLAVLAAAVALTGCASFAGIEPASRPLAPAALGTASDPVDWPAAAWWQGFADPVLDGLIAQALAGNPSLALAESRLAKARALAGVAESALGPQLNADIDSTRRRFSEHADVPPPLAGSMQTISHARLNGSWELDFFGRNRAALDAALGSARAAEADAQAARVLLASDVARAYFRLAALLEQRGVARATLTQRRAILQLVDSRVQAGLDSNVEVRQAEGALPEIRRDLEALDEQIGLARHALAALAGQGPEAAAELAPTLATVRPQALPATLPADLVGRRADLAAARWRVEAATRGIDAAKAAFYPNINLVALAGFSSIGLGNWLKSGSRELGLGAAVHLPIFDAGRLRAGLRGTTADADAAVDSYNATLLQAVREVADQITSQQAVERQAREQQAALAAAESALDLALQRYRAGIGGYLTVLSAETNVLTQRRTAIDLKARGIDTRLQLIRALGGGYTADSTPAAA
ncbi:efflux transporter outer membrane subunit [Aromatoleum aromaticum]|uniref:Outer membrane protein n=1 Tax=Aromatoleum aromaticum (strain DSM 19018 / LMG 30748 / EbN1) TaxID=76114 RepID=Q5P3P5_AROAE|nr:efflux transporter outer membrane subunit [Aromatoleum aromaticum]NMG54377.1 efflux transporter outer membrane subunit [Aromatoleum aromaticum]CAI08069.1 putative outer membrane protein [Aromatoleum aromaticum EbN1]